MREQWEERYEGRYGFWRGFADRAVGAYLDCGILDNGFARVRCGACRAEFLVTFSCKGRGLPPSCAAKRAAALITQLRGGPSPGPYTGAGSCYVEFGHDLVGRVDVDFLSGSKPTGTFQEPSAALAAEKALFGSSRLQRWFSRPSAARG